MIDFPLFNNQISNFSFGSSYNDFSPGFFSNPFSSFPSFGGFPSIFDGGFPSLFGGAPSSTLDVGNSSFLGGGNSSFFGGGFLSKIGSWFAPIGGFLNNFFKSSASSHNSESYSNVRFRTDTNLSELKSVYNPVLGQKLAKTATKNAANRNTRGQCYAGVKDALRNAGLTLRRLGGYAAYEASAILAHHKNFKQVKVSRDKLHELPAGCVVVYNATAGHKYGHITVTRGDGGGASDHLERRMDLMRSDYNVFVPVATSRTA